MAIIWVAVGSLVPGDSPLAAELDLVNDKIVHFTAYAFLAFLPVIAFERRRAGILTALLMILLGAVLEAAQSLSPGRDVEFSDLLMNILGVFCGILSALPVRARLEKGRGSR